MARPKKVKDVPVVEPLQVGDWVIITIPGADPVNAKLTMLGEKGARVILEGSLIHDWFEYKLITK